MARRRRFDVFSLSFLDIMSCGFGAVVLVYLLINKATEETAEVVNRDVLSEIRMPPRCGAASPRRCARIWAGR